MNILLVSQCSGRALNETRRILDQFAERRGERTWQTPITQQGLDTLRQLLRKTARRNTAVACHWIRGRDHSELIWIVGDAKRFNPQGAVPTNTTQRDVLRSHDENDWHTGEDIRLLARMAALFHDIGKANAAFQHKLTSKKLVRDAYRHEWVSLRLFEAFVGKRTDDEWLGTLASLSAKPSDMTWLDGLVRDGVSQSARCPFSKLSRMPPFAQAIGWLVVSHHRLPVQTSGEVTQSVLNKLPAPITAVWNAARADANEKEIAQCWQLDKQTLPFVSASWRQKVSQCAKAMLARPGLLATSWLENPYAIHLARLVLMLADQHYSMQPANPGYGDAAYPLYANTDSAATDSTTKPLKQRLDEHLIGVGEHARKIAGALPRLETQLPRLAQHKGFKRRTKLERFRWQDKAYDLAVGMQQRSQQQGFFGINMASTGCGKTLANGRIMYALANPQLGARFSIALGLRTLTLQTGQAYRERLEFGPDELAVMVGGTAVRELFEMNQTDPQKELDQRGAESAEDLLPDNTHVFYESSLERSPLTTWLEKNPRAHKLLNAPVLICTIDHLMPATEGVRGGHQIVPMLRLLTSDLVLDEPDDFALEDLPALSRLVHWASLLGSRVLLSSATLPPALVQGLFESYKTGRERYHQNRGVPGQRLSICCAWFDEFSARTSDHDDVDKFANAHDDFVNARLDKLHGIETRRLAAIKPLAITADEPKQIRADLAAQMMPLLHDLHRQHHSIDPITHKRVSFGLVRMANIDPLTDVACALLALGAATDSRIHLCVYHSRHPLLIRSAIEQQLDRLLNRSQPEAIFNEPEIRRLLDTSPETDQIMVILGSPVTEVGRDHDYDWAIVEPSSMRSIIQLAGRIRRHRPGACAHLNPNLYLLDTNVKSLEKALGTATFCRPGFESKDFLLNSHHLNDLLTQDQFKVIDAKPRIALRDSLQPHANLVDLEHARLQALMQGDLDESGLAVPPWWGTKAHLTAELQRSQRFRKSEPEERFALLPDDDDEKTVVFQRESDGCWTEANTRLIKIDPTCGPRIGFWGAPDYLPALSELAEAYDMELVDCAKKFGVVQLPKGSENTQARWQYHPALGFRRDRS